MLELFFKPKVHQVFQQPKKKNATASAKAQKVKEPKLSFQKFRIKNFKGIDDIEISLVRNSLVLLLGLNESGKTTILRAIEAFSFLNDPSSDFNPKFFQKIRKKSAVGSEQSAIITATIKIEEPLPNIKGNKLGENELDKADIENINGFIHEINSKKEVQISRVFPFKNGSPKRYFYKIESNHPFADSKFSKSLAAEIVAICPFILYFEDFKDRIPEKIYVNKKRVDSYDPVWYDIIDGLFYNTDPNFNIEKVKKLHNPNNPMIDDAETVETRVNKTLNDTFTKKWKDLSGVKTIEKTVLKYNHHRSAPYFTLKIKDKDGTTYSVDERSKGALWYLSFLMKTEFRSKKMRRNSGKPVFLIDEPASNLHSTAQENMINDFRKLASDTSIIYTTHSQYLISTENIRNTYIIEKLDGVVEAEKWGNYLNKENAQSSYYQPLANLLNIIPNSLSIPWKKSILTEGPSDRHVLIFMNRFLSNQLNEYAIYPGTSAKSLDNLISLNIGWNADFRILLDSDNEGKEAGEEYEETFNLENEIIYLPSSSNKIEKCFTKDEKEKIRKLVIKSDQGKVSKKEFAAMFALMAEDNSYDLEVKNIIEDKTISLFEKLIEKITTPNNRS